MSAPTMSVTFLGTSSGGGPSESRNCSSLVCDMLADQSLWSAESISQQLRTLTFLPVVDCAEGTTRQFALQPHYTKPHVRIQKVSKIFITHMHGWGPHIYREYYSNSPIADHIMGIVPFLRNVLFPPPAGNSSHHPTSSLQKVSITFLGV
jgi:ribonuclease Z